jgi:hypothetical protein
VSDKALRELIDEIKHYRMLADPEWEDEASLARSVDAAESALQTGGWRKWPQEKPENKTRCIVFVKYSNGDGFVDVDLYINGGWGKNGSAIKLWQPLPEVPHDQE